MTERKRMMCLIRSYDFAIRDVAMYLDSHPNCLNGLAYYEKYKRLRQEVVAVYEAKFGPLTIRSNENPTRWTWVDDPWPWEMEG